MKIVFMGTPDFAVGSLQALIRAGHEITLVVTQPDKPKGRSGQLMPPPVKECALAANLPVFQPERIKRPEAVEELRKYEADVFVVAAFGQILSQEILDMPKYGCMNVHASPLPKYRGASPIQQSILDGEEETGITIQQMNAGVDTGDILHQKAIRLSPTETFETLHDRLLVLGGEAIVEALKKLEAGELNPQPQDESKATHVSLIEKSQGKINFQDSVQKIDRQIRGMNPWPSAFTYLGGKQLKIWRAQPVIEVPGVSAPAQAQPGTIIGVEKESFLVQTGSGKLRVLELQLEGKKRMTTQAFLLGMKLEAGEILG